jgi:hypothetical protein
MPKSVPFGARPGAAAASAASRPDPDSWVRGGGGAAAAAPEPESALPAAAAAAAEAAPEASEPMKRLTIDVPASLHRRIKVACALNGVKIADEVRALLEAKFGDVELPGR